MLVRNDGSDPVNGTFENLPEAALFSADLFGSGIAFSISYVGGDGNDVVLHHLQGPTCEPDTFFRDPHTGLTIPHSQIITNDTPAFGGSLSVIEAGHAASGKATVTIAGNAIEYQPDAGYTKSDTFMVTVREAAKGATISLVTIVVPGDEALSQNAATIATDQSDVSLRYHGIPGRSYTCQ